jgi:hypothetical protein
MAGVDKIETTVRKNDLFAGRPQNIKEDLQLLYVFNFLAHEEL